MRRTAAAALAALSLIAVAACSHPKPPAGRWEGYYEAPDAMIVARLEIAPDGGVRISAPNIFGDFADMPPADRQSMHEHLTQSLAAEWPLVEPRQLAFDGKVFRKPDGVAPQLEWDAGTKHMTLVVYPGTHPAIRVPLDPVQAFGG